MKVGTELKEWYRKSIAVGEQAFLQQQLIDVIKKGIPNGTADKCIEYAQAGNYEAICDHLLNGVHETTRNKIVHVYQQERIVRKTTGFSADRLGYHQDTLEAETEDLSQRLEDFLGNSMRFDLKHDPVATNSSIGWKMRGNMESYAVSIVECAARGGIPYFQLKAKDSDEALWQKPFGEEPMPTHDPYWKNSQKLYGYDEMTIHFFEGDSPDSEAARMQLQQVRHMPMIHESLTIPDMLGPNSPPIYTLAPMLDHFAERHRQRI